MCVDRHHWAHTLLACRWPTAASTIYIQPEDQESITPGQAVAVVFMGLVAIIQLNIVLTRTPSFWWWFTPSTAPRPSIFLLLPVALFLMASTFVGVYWPIRIQPDGGRGAITGAGNRSTPSRAYYMCTDVHPCASACGPVSMIACCGVQ